MITMKELIWFLGGKNGFLMLSKCSAVCKYVRFVTYNVIVSSTINKTVCKIKSEIQRSLINRPPWCNLDRRCLVDNP